MRSGCWGLYPVFKTSQDFNTTAQPLWATVSNAWLSSWWKGFSSYLAETSLFSVYVHCLSSSLSTGLGLVLLRAAAKKTPFYFSSVFLHALGRTIQYPSGSKAMNLNKFFLLLMCCIKRWKLILACKENRVSMKIWPRDWRTQFSYKRCSFIKKTIVT